LPRLVVILVMREAGPGPYADRTRGLIAILWRAGLRISEALALTETDLDPKTGSVLVRSGKGGKSRTVGPGCGIVTRRAALLASWCA
jgi:site-specific recombinase XerD